MEQFTHRTFVYTYKLTSTAVSYANPKTGHFPPSLQAAHGLYFHNAQSLHTAKTVIELVNTYCKANWQHSYIHWHVDIQLYASISSFYILKYQKTVIFPNPFHLNKAVRFPTVEIGKHHFHLAQQWSTNTF